MDIRMMGGLVLAAAFCAGVARAEEVQAVMDDLAFSPAVITVPVGTTVTWTNRDNIPHTVTDTDHPKDVKSPMLMKGGTYSRVFTAPGTYHYFCSVHPMMKGTVVVN